VANASATGNVTTTGQRVGGLIGYHRTGTILRNVTATGDVSTDGQRVGGLVGDTDASITDASATGEVTTSTTGEYVGGLVGRLRAQHGDERVRNVTASGNVSSGGRYVGGLIGDVRDDGTHYVAMSEAHATGNVNTTYADESGFNNAYVGGLVGHFEGSEFTDISATGDVTSTAGNEVETKLVGWSAVWPWSRSVISWQTLPRLATSPPRDGKSAD